MMIGTLDFARMVRQTSVPLIPGNIRSNKIRSAPLRSNSTSASGPVAASATSKPSLLSMNSSASRNDSSSSTTNTRVIQHSPCLGYLANLNLDLEVES